MASSSSSPSSERRSLSYMITGPQSIDRIDPLLKNIKDCNWTTAQDSTSPLDFVWETTRKIAEKDQHIGATVLNRLHNSQIIEDKSNLAFLQLRMKSNNSSGTPSETLETYVAKDSSGVVRWVNKRWEINDENKKKNDSAIVRDSSEPEQPITTDTNEEERNTDGDDNCAADWWVVKASKGNGGRDIWIMNENNYHGVLADLHANEEYVIQKYVTDPLLYNGFKFHFRMYAMLKADMTSYLYEKAFILTAGLKYDRNSDDVHKQITNLSINKKIPGHPGQIPINVKETYPKIFQGVTDVWCSILTASAPFLSHQRSEGHFDFYGLDIVCDTGGRCWLIEVNRLPGLESSTINTQQEDSMYDEMMTSLLGIVLKPLMGDGVMGEGVVGEGMVGEGVKSDADDDSGKTDVDCGITGIEIEIKDEKELLKEIDMKTESERDIEGGNGTVSVDDTVENTPQLISILDQQEHQQQSVGFWCRVRGPSEVTYGCTALWRNTFNWRAFTFKNRGKILV